MSRNYVFEDDNPPTTDLSARVVSYTPRAYKVFYEKSGRLNSKEVLINWKSDVLVSFLRVKGIGGSILSPNFLQLTFSPFFRTFPLFFYN